MSRFYIALGVGFALVVAVLGLPRLGAHLVRSRGLPRLEARLGRPVTVEQIEVGWGKLTLHRLTVSGEGEAPLWVERVEVRFPLLALIGERLSINEVVATAPHIQILRDASGHDNLSALLEPLHRHRAGGSANGSVPLVKTIRIVQGRALARDAAWGEVRIGRFDAEIHPEGMGELRLADLKLHLVAGPQASAERIRVRVALHNGKPVGLPELYVEAATASPLRGLSLSGVNGAIRPDPNDPLRVLVDLSGSYGGSATPLWKAVGWARPAERAGALRLDAARFKLSQLDSIFNRGQETTRILNAHNAEVTAELKLDLSNDNLDFDGAFHLAGLTIAHARLGPLPVANLGFDAHARGTLELLGRRLHVREATVGYRSVHASLTAEMAKLGRTPQFTATLQVQPLPCQTVLAALPVEMTPKLRGFKLSGTFYTDLHVGLDLADLDSPVDLGGHVGIEGCKVLEAPPAVRASRLTSTFEQTVEVEPGKWLTFLAGPENPDWVPYDQISPYLINSIMTTEDSGFFKHHGFIPSEFRSALQQNLQRGYFRLGASSITMQMVKNVLLSREKTLSRKLQEMFLTWYIEHSLSKERILEIYFNVIEFGPGIYGIGRAAHHYFGKTAKELLPQEAAWFSSILPNPKRRYIQFCHASGVVDSKWDAYVKRILRRTHERGRLNDADYQMAIAAPLRFNRAEALPERECVALVKRVTAPLAVSAGE